MIREHPFAPPAAQVGMRRPQFPRELGMACGAFPGEMEQRFEPEIGQIEDLLALLHEPDRQQRFGKDGVGAQFRGDARQQHGFPPATRGDNQDVLARRRIDVTAENLKHDAKLAVPYHELRDHLLVGLEGPRIELANLALG